MLIFLPGLKNINNDVECVEAIWDPRLYIIVYNILYISRDSLLCENIYNIFRVINIIC